MVRLHQFDIILCNKFKLISKIKIQCVFESQLLSEIICATHQHSGVTTAPATPAMQGGGTLGGRHITKLTVF